MTPRTPKPDPEPVRQIPTHTPAANLAARTNIISDGPGTVSGD